MEFFVAGTTQTLEVWAPLPPDNDATITIRDAGGATPVSAAAVTEDTTSTTLSAGAAAGAESVTVASATGIVAGYYYRIGSGTTEPAEKVRVRAISSTTITLWSPLAYAHSSAATFKGLRLPYSLSGTTFATPGRDYVATVAWNSAAVAQPPISVAFALSRHALVSSIGETDLLERDPQLLTKLGRRTNLAAAIEAARLNLNDIISAKWPAWTLRGTTSQYREAHIWRTLYELAAQYGQQFAEERKYLLERFMAPLALVESSTNVDVDEDNTLSSWEGGMRSRRLSRG